MHQFDDIFHTKKCLKMILTLKFIIQNISPCLPTLNDWEQKLSFKFDDPETLYPKMALSTAAARTNHKPNAIEKHLEKETIGAFRVIRCLNKRQ